MTDDAYRPARLFTVEQANARLPLVRMIVGDIVELSRDLNERRGRLDVLTRGREAGGSEGYYADELADASAGLERDAERLRGYIRELRELGVELKSAPEGLVDFPAMMEGRLVLLCWKYNEPEVAFWHELDSGFAGRQSLAVGSLASQGTDADADLLES